MNIINKIKENIANQIYLLGLYNKNEELTLQMVNELFNLKKTIEKNKKEVVFIYLNDKRFNFEREYIKEIELKLEEIIFKEKKDYYEFYGWLIMREKEQNWVDKHTKLKFINDKKKVE